MVKEGTNEVRGKLKVLIGIAHPQTTVVAPAVRTLPSMTVVAPAVYAAETQAAIPVEVPQAPPSAVQPSAAATAVLVEAAATAAESSPKAAEVQVPVEVASPQAPPVPPSPVAAVLPMAQMQPVQQVLPQTMSFAPPSPQMMSFALNSSFVTNTSSFTVPSPTASGSMCKATVESFEDVEGRPMERCVVKLRYGGQEASTTVQGCGACAPVAFNESIEFPVMPGYELTLSVEDLVRNEVLGGAATQVTPGYWELHIVDTHGTVIGKLKVVIRIYSGPPLAGPLTEAPVPVAAALPSPPAAYDGMGASPGLGVSPSLSTLPYGLAAVSPSISTLPYAAVAPPSASPAPYPTIAGTAAGYAATPASPVYAATLRPG